MAPIKPGRLRPTRSTPRPGSRAARPASEAVENYLKAILTLSEESGANEAALTRIAAVVGVTPGTATSMVKKLAAAGLARSKRYGAVRLTARGAGLARDVLRRHRIVELFLVEVVGLDWSEVHAEAERLEHAISPRLLDRLDEMLGRPRVDPHGDPIPARDANDRHGPARGPLVPLSDCGEGSRVLIGRILDQDEEFLRFIARTGLRPGTRVRIGRVDDRAGTLELRPDGRGRIAMALNVAQRLMASPPARARQNTI